jgi:hypothetical protein
MRFPTGGPFLEFNFYWAHLAEEEAFGRLVMALLALGAIFRRSDVTSMDGLEHCLTDPHVSLDQVSMEGATGTTRGVAEIITYTNIAEDAKPYDHRPIAIWTEGQWTDGWQHETKAGVQRARTLGRRAKSSFCRLIERTLGSYAALTVACSLRTPYELRHQPDGRAFHDFYVSQSYIGAATFAAVTELSAEAYVEPVADGMYVSCWEFFNPRGTTLLAGIEDRATAVAHCVAAAS